MDAACHCQGRRTVRRAWLPEEVSIIESVETVYVGSGNQTSRKPVATAAEADSEFAGELLVLDGDALRQADREHGSTTTIGIDRHAAMNLTRHGIQDRAFTEDGAYLTSLQERLSR